MTDCLKVMICFSLALSLCFTIGYAGQFKCTVSGNIITCNDTSSDVVITDTSRIWKVVSYPTIDVYGTEYAVGDNMTVWLQLLNSNRTPITNATCFNKIWYPDKMPLNGYKTMAYLDEGIHYYDLTAEASYGVYPLSAKCYIPEIRDFSATYKKDDGSAGSELLVTGNWINANNYTWSNPQASNVDMCVYGRIVGTPVVYWTVNRSNIQLFTGGGAVASWVCNSVSNLTWFNFTGNNYFGLNCTNCGGGNRLYIGYDASNFVSYLYNTSWYHVNRTYFIRLNVTDIHGINETQYQIVMSSGEIHVSESLSNIQSALEYIVTFGSMNLKSNHNVCQDNMTLIHMLTYENCVGNKCFTYQRNETEACAFGCYNDTNWEAHCVPSPVERYLWLIGLFLFALIVLAIAYYKSQ